MNRASKFTAAHVPLVGGTSTVRAPVAVPVTSQCIARVAGEAFDADQITLNCSECGLNEYACLCDDPWGYGPVTKSREQIEADYQWALDRIARVLLGVPPTPDNKEQ